MPNQLEAAFDAARRANATLAKPITFVAESPIVFDAGGRTIPAGASVRVWHGLHKGFATWRDPDGAMRLAAIL